MTTHNWPISTPDDLKPVETDNESSTAYVLYIDDSGRLAGYLIDEHSGGAFSSVRLWTKEGKATHYGVVNLIPPKPKPREWWVWVPPLYSLVFDGPVVAKDKDHATILRERHGGTIEKFVEGQGEME